MKRTVATALALFAAKLVDRGQVVADLDGLGIDFVIVGGAAVFHHGFERFTKDVDIVVNQGDLKKFKESDSFKVNDDGCGPDFWSVEHVPSGTHIDVLVGGGSGFPKVEELQRSPDDRRYVSLSDLVVLKCVRCDMLDLGDVERLLKKRGIDAVDWDHVFSYVTENAKKRLQEVIERVKKGDVKPVNPWAKKQEKR